MSNLEPRPAAHELGGLAAASARPALDLLPGKEVLLGEGTVVRRLLPTLGRRLVGAWASSTTTARTTIGPRARHAGAAAPAHRAADGDLAARGRGAPPRQRSAATSLIRPRRAGADDRRARDRARRAVPRDQHPRCLHGAQLWVALPDGAPGRRARVRAPPDAARLSTPTA